MSKTALRMPVNFHIYTRNSEFISLFIPTQNNRYIVRSLSRIFIKRKLPSKQRLVHDTRRNLVRYLQIWFETFSIRKMQVLNEAQGNIISYMQCACSMIYIRNKLKRRPAKYKKPQGICYFKCT
jgi:hypothetical protein